jgi:hypothetical protein
VVTLPSRLLPVIEETRARVRIGFPWWLRPWLARDVAAITLGRTIFVSKKFAERAPAQMERLLRHELAHVRQVLRLGLVRFLWQYVSEFARHYRRLRSVHQAYLAISFEIEANAAERDEAQTAL